MRTVALAVGLCFIVWSRVDAQWEAPVRLTFDDSASHTSFNNVHCLAAGGSATLHLAWYDHRTGTDQVYYKRSTDNGLNWSQDTALSSGTGYRADPALAAAGEFVHLVWEDARSGNSGVFYRRSTDGGLTWEQEQRLDANNYGSRSPCVCVEESLVHVAWASDSAGRELYYIRSTDRGATWGGPRRLTFDMQESWYPSLAAVGNVVHLVWRDWRDHSFEVYYLRSTSAGASWDSVPLRLSGDLNNGSYNPCIAASGSGVHVIWWDCRITPYELYYRRSTDDGNSWEPETRLTTDTTGTYNPSIAAFGSNVHVVWEALYGLSFIMYKQSSDWGATWSIDTALTRTPDYWSVSPCVAALGTAVHIAWTDFRDSEQGEIYYMRNLSSSGIAENVSYRASGPGTAALLVRDVLWLSLARGLKPQVTSRLLDIAGREVLELHAGANDVSRLAPGVYFIRSASGVERGASDVNKVVIGR